MNTYQKSGSHPLIAKYNAKLEELKALEGEIRRAENSEKAPIPEYGNLVVRLGRTSEPHFHDDPPEGSTIISLTKYLLNPDKKKAWLERWGNVPLCWEESRTSVTYFRNEEGILTHYHGGFLMLKSPALISDEEWESLTRGVIPERLVYQQEEAK